MKKIEARRELRGIAKKTVWSYHLRDLADACDADPRGNAVGVDVSTDHRDCPEDCREVASC